MSPHLAFKPNLQLFSLLQGTSLEAEEEDSQPLSVLREKIVEQQRVVPHNHLQGNAVIDLTLQDCGLPPPPKLHLAPGISGMSELQSSLALSSLSTAGYSPNVELHQIPLFAVSMLIQYIWDIFLINYNLHDKLTCLARNITAWMWFFSGLMLSMLINRWKL